MNTQAQVNSLSVSSAAAATASVNIIYPIGIVKISDMNFGNIITGNAQTIVIQPLGSIPLATGNVALESFTTTATPAVFEVSDNITGSQRIFSGYTVTLPSNDVILVNQDGETMRVTNFTSNATSGNATFINGRGVIYVGATLYVNGEQGLGQYASSSPFPVTVNYY